MLDRFRVRIESPVTEAKSYMATLQLEHLCKECSNPAASSLLIVRIIKQLTKIGWPSLLEILFPSANSHLSKLGWDTDERCRWAPPLLLPRLHSIFL
jgi:hypothetical protein